MFWTDEYIGLPWKEGGRDRDGLDCLGLFALLQRERHGREVVDHGGYIKDAIRADFERQIRSQWEPTQQIVEGSLLLFRVGRYPFHAGYALTNRTMLHIENTANSCIEVFDQMRWRCRFEGAYRFVE